MATDLLAAAAAFAATDVDDLVLLTVLFALAARPGSALRPRSIVVGQVAGIGVLLALSAVAAFGLLAIDERLVALLGLVPLILGLRGLLALVRRDADDDDGVPDPLPTRGGALGVAAITIANGADNIAVYVPLLGRTGADGLPLVGAVFLAGALLWCAIARTLGTRPAAMGLIERTGHWLVPVVLVALGALILVEGLA